MSVDQPKTIVSKRTRAGIASAAALVMLSLGLLACGGGGSDSDDSPATTQRTKNAALNNCVAVISGDRPAAGVTIPRCVPTTIAGNPNRGKRG